MVDILGESDTQSLLSPVSANARVRLLKGIGITLNATTQPLEARINQLTEEGQADRVRPICLTYLTSFATFDELIVAMKLRFLPQHSDFQYRSKFLACK
ncbi:hypothetical protein H310_00240 [Aphanomyces invadans]|uniref:Uncharacterized protein n=1 Tax=Aphanomyces invadans TaxID=157072 RepID=A0A024UUW8_9STRA|nr:hypothetical protein H310_00240 [Aphanomyces invadans]ETW09755.1 hypothetical protein H310_00240 [Aphanomyces invadans]|eukprot:XP_008861166.1 hypothetical protein H310_00240 [Aphanomyces invadans]